MNRLGGSPVILAMTEGSGIWRKAAGSWMHVNPQVQSGAQSSFSWIPGSSTVYFYDHTSGVWRSNDVGVTWTKIWAQPSVFDMTGYVAADPRDPSRLYVSVGNVGLFRLDGATTGTVDAGQIVPQPIGGFVAPGPIAPRSDGAIEAVALPTSGSAASVRVSTDRGASWSTISDDVYLRSGGFIRTLSVAPDAAVWAGSFSDGIAMRPGPSSDLTITAAGAARGTVSSTPTGITCPSACTMAYGWGVPVTLTASADPVSTFTGWNGGGCSGTATCQVTMTQPVSVTATFAPSVQADAQLSLGNGSFVGDGIYNLTGAGQTVTIRQTRGTTRSFRVRVQNDGVGADAFTVPGAGSSSGFQVTYAMGSTDVTSRVTSGTFRTVVLAPGASATLSLSVKVPSSTPHGRVKNILVVATSTSLASSKDAVLAAVTVA